MAQVCRDFIGNGLFCDRHMRNPILSGALYPPDILSAITTRGLGSVSDVTTKIVQHLADAQKLASAATDFQFKTSVSFSSLKQLAVDLKEFVNLDAEVRGQKSKRTAPAGAKNYFSLFAP